MTGSSSSTHPLCRDDESSALLQFKQSFLIDNQYASSNPSGYPKTASWKVEKSSDCCSWDGVKCDGDVGHVISLDLSSSFLYGFINSSSSLFRLVHLQKLNLADNHFNYSQIPSGIGRLSRLTYLNLSKSVFSGQIPLQISELSKLASLDLSFNGGYSSFASSLKLAKADLNSLLQNLTHLKELHLSYVNISAIPHILANFSSLTSLLLSDCGLHGEFPTGIFRLPNLQALNVSSNPYLAGYLPEFNKSSPLKLLNVRGTSFSGKLPDSIGNLNSLNELIVNECNFSGSVPSSIGNLTWLTSFGLSFNNFDSSSEGTLAWLGKQTKLTYLGLAGINLIGEIPSFLGNLTQLAKLNLESNLLTGQIPYCLANLTQLTRLTLFANKLHGPIPESISRLKNLELLQLHVNNLSGTVEFDMFLPLRNLVSLRLGFNKLSLLTNNSMNANLPKFTLLGLAACNIHEFPDFLRHQDKLETLVLDLNKIQGQIPKWIWNVGKETLLVMSVADNFLTGFDEPPVVLPWTSLRLLRLDSNMLQGSLPIPPPSTLFYSVSNNSLTGEISPLICTMASLYALDLSRNNFSGTLPQCLGNFSNSLSILNLQNNNFHGTIPQLCTNGSKLRMIDLSHNQLQGWVPRSLVNCKTLDILDVGNNRINDTFPSWLGTFPELRVLIMRSNEFHGTITSFETKFKFPKLRIIDVSHNSFTGELPFEYFKNWNAMKIINADHLKYMQAEKDFDAGSCVLHDIYSYDITITNKGIETIYAKIPEIFTAIDLSSNRFEGEISKSIGEIKGLQLLNLSNNILIGHIPSCLGNLTKLESLDLSQNKLSGEIPPQLIGLTFLAFFNVSHNHLTGSIPQGKQFDTFQDGSFDGNSGLCGNPLSKKCESPRVSPLPSSTSESEKDSTFPSGYDWIFILTGCISGLVVGLIVGNMVTTRRHEWFVETFGRRPQKRQIGKKRGRGNGT